MTTHISPDRLTSHRLVEQAYEAIEEKLDEEEITQNDIEECQTALQRAKGSDDVDIWVTLLTESEINKLEHQRYPDGEYEWEPTRTNRECLEEIHKPNRINIST